MPGWPMLDKDIQKHRDLAHDNPISFLNFNPNKKSASSNYLTALANRLFLFAYLLKSPSFATYASLVILTRYFLPSLESFLKNNDFQEMNIRIDNNPAHDIQVQYFDFIPPSEDENKTTLKYLKSVLANYLYFCAYLLKSPIDASLALFTFEKFINHKNPSLYKTLLAVSGTLAGLVPWAFGAALKQAAITLDAPVRYYKSPDAKPYDTNKPQTAGTMNTALIPEYVSHHSLLRPPHERVPELIALFKEKKFTFLCLEEVFGHEMNEALAQGLKDDYKYIYSGIAKNALYPVALGSGLLFASNLEVIETRYIYLPIPLVMPSDSGPTFCAEAVARKGAFLALLWDEERKRHILVAFTHLKSNSGMGPIETAAIEEVRGTGLRAFTQATFNYKEELEIRLGIKIPQVKVFGDFNISDVQENGKRTYERTSHNENNECVRTGWKDFSWFFELFPGRAMGSWMFGDHEVNEDVKFDVAGDLNCESDPEANDDRKTERFGYKNSSATASKNHSDNLYPNKGPTDHFGIFTSYTKIITKKPEKGEEASPVVNRKDSNPNIVKSGFQ